MQILYYSSICYDILRNSFGLPLFFIRVFDSHFYFMMLRSYCTIQYLPRIFHCWWFVLKKFVFPIFFIYLRTSAVLIPDVECLWNTTWIHDFSKSTYTYAIISRNFSSPRRFSFLFVLFSDRITYSSFYFYALCVPIS
mgnify:CR=1 FL=1